MKEIKKLRTLKGKFFQDEEGLITAEVFREPVHYEFNGEFRTINNTLIDKGEYYENKCNDFKVKFYKQSPNLFVINNKDYYVEMSILNKEELNMFKDNDNIIFENVYENMDIVYKVISNKLKEEIIIKDKLINIDKINFSVKSNLKLKCFGKKICFMHLDKVVFELMPSFMYDEDGEYNNNLYYEITESNDGYNISLILDKEWLDNEKREYPVIIDPSIVNGTGINVRDTYISSTEPDSNNGTYFSMKVGKDTNGIYRGLMKFELPEIGAGFSVVSARSYIRFASNNPSSLDNIISVHNINTDWDEDGATWNNMNDKYDSRIEAYFLPSESNFFNMNFDVTDLVKEWYSGKPNNGVMLKLSDENTMNDLFSIFCKENDINTSNFTRPYLLITYKNQNGLNNYMSYTDISHKLGSSYVNNLNGNLISNFEINKTVSGKFPINLSLYYNSSDSIIQNDSNISKGWRFNLFETLELVNIDDNDYLLYSEGNGAVHYMYRNIIDNDDGTSSATNEFFDEDGLNLKATTSNDEIQLIDNVSNKKIFTKINNKYYLTKIKDTENNEVNISLTDGKITKIVDANNSEININYSSTVITVSSQYETSKININNNLITSIEVKSGVISFEYNNYNLISKIIDSNGLYKMFEYYEVNPFKVKKVAEYGLNDEIGGYLLFNYEGTMSSVTDNTNKKIVYSFNNNGNTICTRMHTDQNQVLKDAYLVEDNFMDSVYSGYEHYKNKLLSSTPASRFINNLLINSGFEDDIANCNFSISNSSVVLNSANSGNKSLEVDTNGEISYNILKDEYYTLSFYLLSNNNSSFKLFKRYNGIDQELDSIKTYMSEEYIRYYVTGYFEKDTILVLKYLGNTKCNIDDLQLETGRVMNERNMVSNSCFQYGLTNWTGDAYKEVIILDSGEKALKIHNVPNLSTSIENDLKVNGKTGDKYKISFWYKNTGTTKYENASELEGVIVSLGLYGDTPGEIEYGFLNSNKTEWQYYSRYVTAPWDYDTAKILFIFERQANDFYITNISVTKDPRINHYDYDTRGNLISASDFSDNTNLFKYDSNNQLISSFNPMGKNFKYEYDNLKYERLTKGISPTGISNEIKYDSVGNPIRTIINNVNPNSSITDGELYYIRNKGTEKYLTPKLKFLEDNCNKEAFKFVKEGDFYRIKLGSKYIAVNSSAVLLSDNSSEDSLFMIRLNDNGSYSIIKKNDLLSCLSNKNDELIMAERNDDLFNNQFYLEDINTPLYIETKSYYTDDGKFIIRVEDALGNEVKYDINSVNGLVNKITNPYGRETIYTYDSEEKITSIKEGNHLVNYTYNDDLISKITCENKEYNFTYDNFYNNKEVFVNNNKIITFDYEPNNGNLSKKTYGNNDEILYNYDDLERISKVIKEDKTYEYFYNNNGQTAKILSNEDSYIFNYDLAKRLSTFIYNDFMIDYTYNKNGAVTKVKHRLNDLEYTLDYTYNDDDYLIKATINNISFNYNFDYLGRVVSTNINDNLNTEYTYITNGNKTSLMIKTITVGSDVYKYNYDKLSNITNIYLNDNLINEYQYNDNNELIYEVNHLLNKKYKYIYDNNGNILFKLEYDLNDSLLSSYKYEYSDNTWKDKLTKFNDEVVTYDEIGNPITIGNSNLSWMNGRELSNYANSETNISYKYDLKGIRTSKIVNGIETIYFTENSNIIFEKTGNNVIYYIRDENDNLIGLLYNNEVYYYKKNYQNDIIGIYNSNYELIVNYTYDSWGKLISITDKFNNPIINTSHIGIINPFRYRSYYYDQETGFYYLNSRYYNPLWGRFITPDTVVNSDIRGINLYVYCGNNPISRKDDEGNFWSAACALAGGAFNWGLKVVSNVRTGEKWYKGTFGAFVGGAVAGAMTSVGLGIASSYASVFVEDITNEAISYTNFANNNGQTKKKFNKANVKASFKKTIKDTAYNGTLNCVGGKLSSKMTKIGKTWIKPTTFKSSFTGRYAKRQWEDMIISNEISTLGDQTIQIAKIIHQYSRNYD